MDVMGNRYLELAEVTKVTKPMLAVKVLFYFYEKYSLTFAWSRKLKTACIFLMSPSEDYVVSQKNCQPKSA